MPSFKYVFYVLPDTKYTYDYLFYWRYALHKPPQDGALQHVKTYIQPPFSPTYYTFLYFYIF